MFPSLPSSSRLFPPCLLLFFFLLNHTPPAAADTPLYQFCGDTGNYTNGSTYASNLNTLLTSLDSNTSLSGGFLNTTVGQTPNQVYGLADCRGDVNASACRSCLDSAIKDAPDLCPNYKGAIIWYDYCLLRYSDKRFFSTFVNSSKVLMFNSDNIANASLFDQLLDVLMGRIANWTAYNSTKMFATGEMMKSNKPPFPAIYGLAQCTLDLSRSQCWQCLSSILDPRPKQFEGKQGARVLYGSCTYRYEIYSFYEGAPTLRLQSPVETEPTMAPAPAPGAPPLITPPEKNRKGDKIVISSTSEQSYILSLFQNYDFICQ